MISLIQLVTQASVDIEGERVAEIADGILALVGFEKSDTLAIAQKQLDKILQLRIFPDADGKSNLNVTQIQGGILLVPQFTLVADTDSGKRPSYSRGMSPQEGRTLFAEFLEFAKQTHPIVQAGVFGANMQVQLCNNGPMTFILKSSR